MPTDADIAAFAESLELRSKLGLEVHEWAFIDGEWQSLGAVYDCDKPTLLPKKLNQCTVRDIDAAIAVLARWLSKMGYVCVRDDFLGHWLYYPHGEDEGTAIDCPDSELAALVAAVMGVGK